MKNIELRNEFHGTVATVRTAPDLNCDSWCIRLTQRQAKRARAKLCGSKDCRCSGTAGIRGRQHYQGKPLDVVVW